MEKPASLLLRKAKEPPVATHVIWHRDPSLWGQDNDAQGSM